MVLVVVFWLLVVGCWLLVVGCLLLVVGCWLVCGVGGVVVDSCKFKTRAMSANFQWPSGRSKAVVFEILHP